MKQETKQIEKAKEWYFEMPLFERFPFIRKYYGQEWTGTVTDEMILDVYIKEIEAEKQLKN